MQLQDSTVLVTGGASGLGEGVVRRFTAAGARVLILDLNAERGATLASELGERVAFARADVADEAQVGAAVEAARALGGRLDQSLANVLLMAHRDWPATIHLVDANEIATVIATVIHGGEAMTLQAAPGSTMSLLPLSAEVTGITYTGMLYPLDNATIALGSTRGVSNEVLSQPATVRIATGIALVIQSVS